MTDGCVDELVVGLLHKARGEEICFHLHVGDTLPYGHEGNGLKVGTFMAAHIDEGTGTPICTVAVGGEGGVIHPIALHYKTKVWETVVQLGVDLHFYHSADKVKVSQLKLP